jgi:hypothetical protein
MPRKKSKKYKSLAEKFSINYRRAKYWRLDRPMTELARRVLVNEIRRRNGKTA